MVQIKAQKILDDDHNSVVKYYSKFGFNTEQIKRTDLQAQ